MDLQTYLATEDDDPPGPASPAPADSTDGSYPGDPRVYTPPTSVRAQRQSISRTGFDLTVELAAPSQDGTGLSAVVVVHENKGLVDYVTDVVRRLAAAGYVAAAPDLLSHVGGTAALAGPDEVATALRQRSDDDVVADVRAVVEHLRSRPDVDAERIGVLGFCYGGGVAWRVLTQVPGLRAGVPFYGPPPDPADLSAIEGSVMAVYGGLDDRITSTLPATQAAMFARGKQFEAFVVDDAGHAFHNDTNPARYHADGARAAWTRTLEHFERWLR